MATLKLDIGLRPKQLNAITENLAELTREVRELHIALANVNLIVGATATRRKPKPVPAPAPEAAAAI
jgi:fructose-bisphosphate aldolase class 1